MTDFLNWPFSYPKDESRIFVVLGGTSSTLVDLRIVGLIEGLRITLLYAMLRMTIIGDVGTGEIGD